MSHQHPLGEPSELLATQCEQTARKTNDQLMFAASRMIREERQKRVDAETRIKRATEILTALSSGSPKYSDALTALSDIMKELIE